jgi:F-type H+-transporting ATPase subunit delta
MASDPIARAYAEALFRIAVIEDAVDDVEGELIELQRILSTTYELKGFLDDLSITTEGKKKAVAELFEGKLSPMTLNVVYTAVERNRHRSLPGIAEVFSDLASGHRGQVTAEVITALPIPEEMAGKLKATLSKVLNKKVYLRQVVDTSIIGGCVVKVGDKIIDGCIQTRLQDLRASMVEQM